MAQRIGASELPFHAAGSTKRADFYATVPHFQVRIWGRVDCSTAAPHGVNGGVRDAGGTDGGQASAARAHDKFLYSVESCWSLLEGLSWSSESDLSLYLLQVLDSPFNSNGGKNFNTSNRLSGTARRWRGMADGDGPASRYRGR